MLKLFVPTLFLLTNLLIAQTIDMEKKLEELKKQFAPDSRVAIFEYTLDKQNKLLTVKTDNVDAVKKLGILRSSFGDFNLQVELLPAENLGDEVYGIINLSVANLRKEHRHASELVSQAILGTQVKVLQKSGEWYRIQTPDKYISWTDDDGLALKNFQDLDAWKISPKIIYLKEFGFSYKTPDENSMHVSDLVLGNILKLVAEEGEYYKVEYPDGRIAFVPISESAKYDLWLKSINPDAKKVIKTAYRFMGLPYLWGGTSAKGVDCSGFTKTVYFVNGILLPRDASQQILTGERVDTENGFENLKPGDLLFFGRKAEEGQKEKITHVAIYIGNMEFIHAAGKVKINSLDPKAPNFSKYRLETFIRAKRILNSLNKNGIETVNQSEFYSE